MDEIKYYREFTVTPGVAGFKVKIGCTEVYFGDAHSLGLAIERWLKNPVATEQSFLKDDQRYPSLDAPPRGVVHEPASSASPGFRGVPTPD